MLEVGYEGTLPKFVMEVMKLFLLQHLEEYLEEKKYPRRSHVSAEISGRIA